MNDDAAPVSNRNEPVAVSVPIVMVTGGVLSNACCAERASSGLGPMKGLSSSFGPGAPSGVTVENCANEAYVSFTWRFVVGMPGLVVAVAELNGVPGL